MEHVQSLLIINNNMLLKVTNGNILIESGETGFEPTCTNWFNNYNFYYVELKHCSHVTKFSPISKMSCMATDKGIHT